MKSHEIRRRFLDYFAGHGHEVVPSSGLVPANDPTLFFTNAGMVQFKDVFLGNEVRPYRRATSSQKCLRVSGKHNDLEVVGRTPRHHTFFEMLGNFSFGDYFKEDAIRYAWELLTGPLQLPAERLWVTVFEEDDEAFELWRSLDVVPVERIQRMGAKDNFWAMGDTGPCGPCSEIFFDHGPAHGADGGPAADDNRYVEIWNLVFMQFERDASGEMRPLPRPSIDTGAGLERLAAASEGLYWNYDTDLFRPLIAHIERLAGKAYAAGGEDAVAMRVLADHARAAAFLVSEGVLPSNEERGYVLRRIVRRAIRYGVKLGLEGSFFHTVTDAVADRMGEAWPELLERRDFVREVVRGEEERFAETLDKGLALLDREFARLEGRADEKRVLDGEVAFRLYDTYGFPLDLTRLIAEERGVAVDVEGYERAMEGQRAKGRAAWKGSGEAAIDATWHALRERLPDTEFRGYEEEACEGRVLALVSGGPVEVLGAGARGQVVVDRTPFYAESGGQVGDRGAIRWEGGEARVLDTRKPVAGLIAHEVEVVSGRLAVGAAVHLDVDGGRRQRTRLNHTATHLLHAALRAVLGEHVVQKGSLVAPDRLRFDFVHHKALSPEELDRVEDLVNARILDNIEVETRITSLAEARAAGAMALFGEKYGERVRLVSVPGFSLELCGGTHVRRTGDIGQFRITAESGIAAGVRRVEAVTGPGALALGRRQQQVLRALSGLLRTPPDELPTTVERLVEERKRVERELEAARRELARAEAGDLASRAVRVEDFQVLAAEMDADTPTLRTEAERLRDTLGSAVVVLAARDEGAVRLVGTVSKDLVKRRVHAGHLVRELARMVGGGGGGRPDMAQAGGKRPEALPEALGSVVEVVRAQLGG